MEPIIKFFIIFIVFLTYIGQTLFLVVYCTYQYGKGRQDALDGVTYLRHISNLKWRK